MHPFRSNVRVIWGIFNISLMLNRYSNQYFFAFEEDEMKDLQAYQDPETNELYFLFETEQTYESLKSFKSRISTYLKNNNFVKFTVGQATNIVENGMVWIEFDKTPDGNKLQNLFDKTIKIQKKPVKKDLPFGNKKIYQGTQNTKLFYFSLDENENPKATRNKINRYLAKQSYKKDKDYKITHDKERGDCGIMWIEFSNELSEEKINLLFNCKPEQKALPKNKRADENFGPEGRACYQDPDDGILYFILNDGENLRNVKGRLVTYLQGKEVQKFEIHRYKNLGKHGVVTLTINNATPSLIKKLFNEPKIQVMPGEEPGKTASRQPYQDLNDKASIYFIPEEKDERLRSIVSSLIYFISYTNKFDRDKFKITRDINLDQNGIVKIDAEKEHLEKIKSLFAKKVIERELTSNIKDSKKEEEVADKESEDEKEDEGSKMSRPEANQKQEKSKTSTYLDLRDSQFKLSESQNTFLRKRKHESLETNQQAMEEDDLMNEEILRQLAEEEMKNFFDK